MHSSPRCNSRKCSQAATKFPKVSKRNSTVHGGCDCNVRSALSGSSESGRGQPHSKTLARATQPGCFREVLECGCPLPLFLTANMLPADDSWCLALGVSLVLGVWC